MLSYSDLLQQEERLHINLKRLRHCAMERGVDDEPITVEAQARQDWIDARRDGYW